MASLTDLQTLRAFVTVAREGSVSRAALKLHLSQPAISLQLKSLASSKGLKLFTRTPHGLALTRDGAALLPQAEKVLSSLADFNRAASCLHSTVRGRLRIGTILDPEFTRLGAFLKELVESAPQIETELRQSMSGNVLTQVLKGELDVGFYLDSPKSIFTQPPQYSTTKTSAAEEVEVKILSRFTYRILAPAGWGEQVLGRDWKELAALPWLATPPASAHHRMLHDVFSPLGVDPHRVALVDQEASMLDLVRSGVGLSLVRDAIAIREVQERGLVIADRVHLDCDLTFVCLKSRLNEPVIASAWTALHKIWR